MTVAVLPRRSRPARQTARAGGGMESMRLLGEDLSLTTFLPAAKRGDADALNEITRRLLPRVLRVVERELRGMRAADAECVADSVFVYFWKSAEGGAFGRDNFARSEELWAYLMRVARNKVTDYARNGRALKRDCGRTLGEDSVWHKSAGETGGGFDALDGGELRPEERAAFAETFEEFMAVLPEPVLREIVILKLELCTVDEIADELNTSPRTVKRKLKLIRDYWDCLHGAPRRPR